MFAPKLKKGDGVRVIAPSRSLARPWITNELKALAQERLEALGLRFSFSQHVNDCDDFESSSIEHRIEDLHSAFADTSVQLILTVIGGYNSNQLLRYIDYDLIKNNPKILCGFSDITALATAIYAKTGLVTYSGPHFFNFGQKKEFDYTLGYFQQCMCGENPIDIRPSGYFIDDLWANKQDSVEVIPNEGWHILQEGEASGVILGGNLGTLHLLQGTEYMPQTQEDIILFIEDDREDNAVAFDRHLQSLLHQKLSSQVRGVVIGRMEQKSGITLDLLKQIIASKKELHGLPILAGLDFGHTTPMFTFPIGGRARMVAAGESSQLIIETH